MKLIKEIVSLILLLGFDGGIWEDKTSQPIVVYTFTHIKSC
jgi:hypothetical protein